MMQQLCRIGFPGNYYIILDQIGCVNSIKYYLLQIITYLTKSQIPLAIDQNMSRTTEVLNQIQERIEMKIG